MEYKRPLEQSSQCLQMSPSFELLRQNESFRLSYSKDFGVFYEGIKTVLGIEADTRRWSQAPCHTSSLILDKLHI